MRGSRTFRQGGEGLGQSDKKALTTFCFISLFYSRKWLLSKKTIIIKVPEGVKHFPGGGGGVHLLIPIENI